MLVRQRARWLTRGERVTESDWFCGLARAGPGLRVQAATTNAPTPLNVRYGCLAQRCHRARNALHSRPQVELAQTEYQLPRLTKMWSHLDRVGGGGQVKGTGEKQIEIDKRLLRDKAAQLRRELEAVRARRWFGWALGLPCRSSRVGDSDTRFYIVYIQRWLLS